MSLQIYIAHTGDRLQADPVSFTSFDALQTWISKNAPVQPQNQILMSSRGKQVKLQTLLTEKEIFVYDRQYIATAPKGSPGPSIPSTIVPSPFSPTNPPDRLANQNDLQAWKNLFKERRDWTVDLLNKCTSMTNSIHEQRERSSIIYRGINVGVDNLHSHVRSLQQKYADAKAWAEDLLRNHREVIEGWESTLSKLEQIHAKGGFQRVILGRDAPGDEERSAKSGDQDIITLVDFINADAAKKAGSLSSTIIDRFNKRIVELGVVVELIQSESQELHETVSKASSNSVFEIAEESVRLIEDVEVVTRKVSSDYEHVLGLQASSKTISQASKMALLHTRNYLPSLSESAVEIGHMLRQAVEHKNALTESTIRQMQTISAIESMLANVHSQLSSLDLTPDGVSALEYLTQLSRLPLTYGAVLIEAVRRSEWSEKIKIDSSALAEEIASFKEEEERRRRKWLKSMDGFISTDITSGRPIGVELNLQGDEDTGWPSTSREDVNLYIEELQHLGDMEETVKELSQAANSLDRPTRQQTKVAKAFKMGSVHDFGKGSMLMRGDTNNIRGLREEKLKLEEKLKGSESRVRKLEDLLHRQSHISRNASGNLFQASSSPNPEQQLHNFSQNIGNSTRPQDAFSRRSSVSSRRFSANQVPEDKALLQRILNLEAELLAEREHHGELRKEANARTEAEQHIKARIEEATSIKNDLLGNLEAQQREFSDERKLLNEELRKLKHRNEELEDELDRALGSRDNARSGVDQRYRSLEMAVDEAQQGAIDQAKEMQKQIDSQQKEAERLKVENGSIVEAMTRLRAQADELQNQVSDNLRDYEQHLSVLQETFECLTPKDRAPAGFAAILNEVSRLAERAVASIRGLETDLSMVRQDSEMYQERICKAEAERDSLSEKLDKEIQVHFEAQDRLAEEQARTSSLSACLEDERNELQNLRSKFADGETGSETLKARILAEEQKVADLSEKLAVAEAHSVHLNEETSLWRRRAEEGNQQLHLLKSRLNGRTSRAKHLSQRLYSHNERLGQLLESLGFSVTRRDNSIVIQRVPRSSSAAASTNDLEASRNPSLSRSIPAMLPWQDEGELDLLAWMQAEDAQDESTQFQAFLQSIDRFDLIVFSEVITKRIKETEHLARKWQRETRSYRDKAHRAQAEAHGKIAFRSFKEGDLALFLPTRNQATRPWAAFNVGAPHYFLREQDSHKLSSRDWLLARISRVEERIVDLSKSMGGAATSTTAGSDRRSIGETSEGAISFDDENPFELSDGLRWYLLDAYEEKPGAPTTPGLGKSTVASAHVDAKGSIGIKKPAISGGVTKTLSKSLDSRRSSSTSKRSVIAPISAAGPSSAEPSRGNTLGGPQADNASSRDPDTLETAAKGGGGIQEVRNDLLWGP
ncbi:hypothetical protein L228DRAFT_210734 [Xylona heveae TC161]|uniref:Autophagy-related protein 11 n=1 Tax=Xylona heveae (strain CBS 132557 / TC161) TaxID=1328760 RepID=A0A165GRD3_XYLHT|nr:hypothetical protein L228DRAFT_210734 [Xylona heveae TC161]KZF22499.1 hypothetical protein L228DRAFT_210734 [Xylona heveae TC161]